MTIGYTWNTAWERDDSAFASVGCCVRFEFPFCNNWKSWSAQTIFSTFNPATRTPPLQSSLKCIGPEGLSRSCTFSLYTYNQIIFTILNFLSRDGKILHIQQKEPIYLSINVLKQFVKQLNFIIYIFKSKELTSYSRFSILFLFTEDQIVTHRKMVIYLNNSKFKLYN